MLSFQLPHYKSNSPGVPLDENAAFRKLAKIDKDLRNAKDSMEPYFKTYERSDGRNIFKTVISNFESFKQTRFEIAKNRNTPSVSNAWIKAYELVSRFNLIPDTVDNDWNHFDNCSFPGSFILAVYHYIHTKWDKKIRDRYNWYASSLLSDVTQDNDHPDAALGDQYELYKRYGEESSDGINHWLMNEQKGLKGDILDINYIYHVEKTLQNSIDLYTSEYGVDVSEKKMYNEQEFVHAQGDLMQILCGIKVLKNGGNLVCKIFTFFNPFTISLIALLTDCFESLYICKPTSSKPDNSEVFIVGKNFNASVKENISDTIEQFIDRNNIDYRKDTLIELRNLSGDFWAALKNAAEQIFEKLQIERIKSNIKVFEELIYENGDPNTSYDIEDRIKKMSRYKYKDRIKNENDAWFNDNPVLVLHKHAWLDVINITDKPQVKVFQPNNKYKKEYKPNKPRETFSFSKFGKQYN